MRKKEKLNPPNPLFKRGRLVPEYIFSSSIGIAQVA